jgi:hypothetical protein
MPPVSPTLFVAHFLNRQVDRIRMPRGRLHIRDDQGEMQSLRGSLSRLRGDEAVRKVACPCFFGPKSSGFWISPSEVEETLYLVGNCKELQSRLAG